MSALLMASASAFARDKLEVLAHDSIFKDESLQEVKVVARKPGTSRLRLSLFSAKSDSNFRKQNIFYVMFDAFFYPSCIPSTYSHSF